MVVVANGGYESHIIESDKISKIATLSD